VSECKSGFWRISDGCELFEYQVDYHPRIMNQCFLRNGLGERVVDVDPFARRGLRQIERRCPLVSCFLLLVSV
jgi:hypothetical protein